MEDRTRAHLENQLRLLREDMLGELRSDMQIALGIKKRGRRTATVLGALSLVDASFHTRFNPDGHESILVHCRRGLERLYTLAEKDKRDYLKSNPGFLKHQSFGAFYCNKELLTFGFIWKDESGLLRSPPVVEIQMIGADALCKVLNTFLENKPLYFALVDTSVFAYEPVLRRPKNIKELPLDTCLLNLSGADQIEFKPRPGIQNVIDELTARLGRNWRKISNHTVDKDQLRSIVDALSRPVSTILGPPGKRYPSYVIVGLEEFRSRAHTCL